MKDITNMSHTIGGVMKPSIQTHYDPAEAFMSIISRNDEAFMEIPLTALESLAAYALRNRLDTVLKNIVDISLQRLCGTTSRVTSSSTGHNSLPFQQDKFVLNLLDTLSNSSRNPVAEGLILPLVDAYLSLPSADGQSRNLDSLEALPLHVLVKSMRLMSERQHIKPYLETLTHLFWVVQSKRSSRFDLLQVTTSGTWTLYRTVRCLIEEGYGALAYELFPKLVGASDFPHSAQEFASSIIASTEFDSSSEHLQALMLLTITKACQSFRWYDRMLGTAEATIPICTQTSDKSTLTIVSNGLHSMIRVLAASDTEKDLRYGVRMIELCTSQPLLFPVPQSLVSGIYEKLEANQLREEASRLFLHLDTMNAQYHKLRDEAEPARRRLTAPAQVGLMQYYFEIVGEHGALRKLVEACMISGGVAAIECQFIAANVAIMAEAGMEDHVRGMWEQMRRARHREMLHGNGKAAMRVAKLFCSMAERADHQREPFLHGKPLLVSGAVVSAEPQRPVQVAQKRPLAEEYRAFAQRVAVDFTKLKEPLETASHMDLTTVARINFLAGNLRQGFVAARYILERREIPDTIDINVMLKALADLDPRAAAVMLEKALTRRVYVDRVSWSTLLHGATKVGDTELVLSILQRCREMGGSFDVSAIDAFIRGFDKILTVSSQNTEHFLRLSLQLLRNLEKPQRAKMGTLGVLCVQRALKANLPLLAFEYWDLLVRYRLAGFKSPRLRLNIAKAVSQAHRKNKDSSGSELSQRLRMCETLGAPTQQKRLSPTRIPLIPHPAHADHNASPNC
ncbi:uncharacterized protein EI90DRAFT_3037203 [Cantharellus anzutake]|uniref:uncharacterized protein n=1 Tax=Cantharellus anzutake TaxID=1750568 RepID=UPI001904EC6E|nr:uncharacterized protein EI90DRAFT_3037203 [Cantharellus anzutake]KAF8339603.1 hypothetical protein EI90DRAFT_3037203 [Cantharellus anzutake]